MLKDLILSEKTKGIIAIIAAIVMYYTPDWIDAIIQGWTCSCWYFKIGD